MKDNIARKEERLERLRKQMGDAPRRQARAKAPTTETPRAAAPRPKAANLILLGKPNNLIPPFIEEVTNTHISRKFKMSTIKSYDGTGDPANHVRTFSNALFLEPVSDALKCRAFPQTLGGKTQRWYNHLPPNSIGSSKDLSKAFTAQFVSRKIQEKRYDSLMNMRQRSSRRHEYAPT